MEFEWDEAKAKRNLAKHGVRFDGALHVFDDPDVVLMETFRANDQEDRFKAVGKIGDRMFTVIFTQRTGAIRLISARRANAGEEREYAHRSVQN